MNSLDTVKALKHRIAEQYGEPPRSLRVIADKELKEELKTIQECKIIDRQQIFVKKKVPDIVKKKDDPENEEEEGTYDVSVHMPRPTCTFGDDPFRTFLWRHWCPNHFNSY